MHHGGMGLSIRAPFHQGIVEMMVFHQVPYQRKLESDQGREREDGVWRIQKEQQNYNYIPKKRKKVRMVLKNT